MQQGHAKTYQNKETKTKRKQERNARKENSYRKEKPKRISYIID